MHKKECRVLNYFEHFFIFSSNFGVCASISVFASLVSISIGITSPAVGLKICPITASIKNYESIFKKKRKKHDKIVLLAKTKLNAIEVLISKALIDSYINHDKFVSVNNVLKAYNEIKEEIKNPENA